MTTLYEPLKLGRLTLKNRVFMAPLTRNRARADGVPSRSAAIYYSQRASAGLIITEATQVSPMGKGYINTPGIHSSPQIAEWARIAEAVHEAGGRIFLQLWHVGRIAHSSLLPQQASPLAPSAIRARAQTVTEAGFVDVSEPQAMTSREIREVIGEFRSGALNAKIAGFDGVEIHAANGYLIDQFLRTGSNVRTDAYGGSAEKRVRFLREVTEAVLGVWSAPRVGVRISPFSSFNDMSDDAPAETFDQVVATLNELAIGYLHVVEELAAGQSVAEAQALFSSLRKRWSGLYIANGGYQADSAERSVSEGNADAVSFGKLFLANPDLPKRLQLRGPYNPPIVESFYGGTDAGYIDYPTWPAASEPDVVSA